MKWVRRCSFALLAVIGVLMLIGAVAPLKPDTHKCRPEWHPAMYCAAGQTGPYGTHYAWMKPKVVRRLERSARMHPEEMIP